MSAHVLLNLLNELGKRVKMRGLSSISSLFRNEFNKFNNTRAPSLLYGVISLPDATSYDKYSKTCFKRHFKKKTKYWFSRPIIA